MTEVQEAVSALSLNEENNQTERDVLIVRLDELLEEYLNKLDEYEKARDELSKQLSAVLLPSNKMRTQLTHQGLSLACSGKLPKPFQCCALRARLLR